MRRHLETNQFFKLKDGPKSKTGYRLLQLIKLELEGPMRTPAHSGETKAVHKDIVFHLLSTDTEVRSGETHGKANCWPRVVGDRASARAENEDTPPGAKRGAGRRYMLGCADDMFRPVFTACLAGDYLCNSLLL